MTPDRSTNSEIPRTRVDVWIESFVVNERGEVLIPEMDPIVLKGVFSSFGAEFDSSKEWYKKLSQPTNKFRRPGMDAVWTHDYIENYNQWTTAWAEAAEDLGIIIPRLSTSGKRTSGMRHFLGETTALAAGILSLEDYRKRIGLRIYNGWAFQHNLPRQEADFLPGGKKLPGSIPPGYIKETWGHIKNRTFKNGVPVPRVILDG